VRSFPWRSGEYNDRRNRMRRFVGAALMVCAALMLAGVPPADAAARKVRVPAACLTALNRAYEYRAEMVTVQSALGVYFGDVAEAYRREEANQQTTLVGAVEQATRLLEAANTALVPLTDVYKAASDRLPAVVEGWDAAAVKCRRAGRV
jgi:hypothetical protein